MSKPKKQAERIDPIIPNGIVGIIFFIAAEVMLFAALISAFMILRAGVPVWPPWGQPFLPVKVTLFNTLILIVSGAYIWKAKTAYVLEQPIGQVKKFYRRSIFFAVVFIGIQMFEWVDLVEKDLTMTSSIYGGMFYLIIGMHVLHAVAAILALFYVGKRLDREDRRSVRTELTVVQSLWTFVVGIWPVIFWIVYLS